MKKRLLSIVLTMALVMGLLPAISPTAQAATPLTYDISQAPITISVNPSNSSEILINGYLTASGTVTDQSVTPSTCDIVITGSTATNKITVNTPSGLTPNITLLNANIDVSGTSGACAFDIQNSSVVNLTLDGTNTLESGITMAGLQVKSGASVTIGGKGYLTAGSANAPTDYTGAGIGGCGRARLSSDTSACSDAGTITINSGNITANGAMGSGGNGSAGIGGGGYSTNGGTIAINGGTITASGANAGAGIGGTNRGAGGNIIITDGTVTAISVSGAGIGGGNLGGPGNIKISDKATIKAATCYTTKSVIDSKDNMITPDSGTAANILAATFTASFDNTSVIVKNSSNATVAEFPNSTSWLGQVALSVPQTGTYTLYKGTSQQTQGVAGSESADFTVNTGLNLFANVNNAPTYTGSTNPSSVNFTSARYGYTPSERTVLINNTGTGSLTNLTASLSGTNASAFTLSNALADSIAAGGNTTMGVKPQSGLPAGTYTATLTITGDHSFSLSIPISFTVSKAQLTAAYAGETISYGGTPALTVNVTGFVNGETAATAAEYTAPTVTNANTTANSYRLTPSGGTAKNYTFKYVGGTLTINPDKPTIYAVTINVNKDGASWSGHGKTFKLVKGITDYTNLNAVPNGIYDVYEGIGDTGINVTVNGAATSATVDYFTVALTKGTGVDSVSGGGTYLKGSKVSIDVAVSPNHIWSKWTQTTGGADVSAAKSFAITGIAVPLRYTANATQNNSGGSSGSSSGSGSTLPTNTNVTVDNKDYSIGSEHRNGGSTTASVDQGKLTENIEKASKGSAVIVPVSVNNTAAAQFVVANIEDMAKKDMTLTVQTGKVAYNLDTSAIDVSALATAFPGANTQNIPFSVSIKNSSIEVRGATLVVSPVEFTVTASYNGKTVSVDTFSSFVNRTIEIKAEQAKQITTAVVVEANGTLRHVPTKVIVKNGKYYALINSRTNSTYTLISNSVSFCDAEGKWYKGIVNEMASRKVINGIGDNNFAGENAITRSEFAAITVRSLGLPANGSASFSDVPANAWYSGAVATAAQYGIVSGKGDNKFDPTACITREEAMAMIYRASRLTPYKAVTAVDNTRSFTDYGTQSDWAGDAVNFNLNNAFIVGAGGTFSPKSTITRAEVATVVLRLLQKAELIDVR